MPAVACVNVIVCNMYNHMLLLFGLWCSLECTPFQSIEKLVRQRFSIGNSRQLRWNVHDCAVPKVSQVVSDRRGTARNHASTHQLVNLVCDRLPITPKERLLTTMHSLSLAAKLEGTNQSAALSWHGPRGNTCPCQAMICVGMTALGRST